MAFDLNTYRTNDKNELTHLLMSSPGGKFKIPLNKEFKLFKYIKKNPEVCITQRPSIAFPLFFDIDNLNMKIENAIKIINEPLSELFTESDLTEFYVLKNLSKKNYHIHYPKIIVSKSTAILIVNKINTSHKDLLDVSVYTNGLRLYPTLKPKKKNKKEYEDKSFYGFVNNYGKGKPGSWKLCFEATTIRTDNPETPYDQDEYDMMLDSLEIEHEEQEEQKQEQKSQEEIDDSMKEVKQILTRKFGKRQYTLEKGTDKNGNDQYKVLSDNFCFVTQGTHNDKNQSCIFIKKTRIYTSCFSHDTKNTLSMDGDWKRIKFLLGLTKKDGSNEKTDFQRLVEKLTAHGKKHNYKRNGGYIMKPKPNIPIIYEKYMEYSDYLNMIFGDINDQEFFQLFRKSPYNFQKLLNYLEKVDDPNLEFVRTNRYIFAFQDGYLNIEDFPRFEFTKWKDMKHAKNLLTSVYYDRVFDSKLLQEDEVKKMETPIFDKICNHHFQDNKEIYGFFLGMMGRLHYPIHTHDRFNCIPFIKGGSNTGKSTTGNIITYNHQNIGTISGKMEDTFGLQTLYKRNLIYVQECPKNLSKKLDKSDFQRMIEGSRIDIPRKGLESINHEWDTPMLFLGNYFPGYQDQSGAIPRRLCIFFMDRFVKPQDRDTSLEKKCIENEAHLILLKTLNAYKDLINKYGDKTFEDWNIGYFKKGREELMVNCNHLYKFLNLAPGDWECWPIHEEGSRIEVNGRDKFKEVYERYLKYQTKSRNQTWEKDVTTLERMDFKLITEKVCGRCGKTFEKKDGPQCCKKFTEKNLREKDYILNMKIIGQHDMETGGTEIDSDIEE